MNAPLHRQWDSLRQNRGRRLERAASLGLAGKNGKEIPVDRIIDLLEAVIQPGDRVCLEGNNQKQADFLSEALADCDPARINHLSMVQSVLALPSHVDLFERGLASRLDFSFSGPQGARLAKLVQEQRIEIGSIHTYLELFGRYFLDLTPNVALIAAQAADAEGNLYLGPNTEDTPAIVEATAFKGGIVIAQVNERLEKLPRVDVPADWVDFTVLAPKPNYIEPLFTRDPAQITEVQVLMAMMAIKGIYAEYGVTRLNHGIGFDTADRAAAADLRRRARPEGQYLHALGAQPAPDADPGHRIRLRRIGALLRFGSRHGRLHLGPFRRFLHRCRRQHAFQPGVFADGRPLRLRHVYRLDAADGPRR